MAVKIDVKNGRFGGTFNPELPKHARDTVSAPVLDQVHTLWPPKSDVKTRQADLQFGGQPNQVHTLCPPKSDVKTGQADLQFGGQPNQIHTL